MRAHRWFTPYLLVGPAIIWVLLFSIWPFVNTIFLSFTNARPLRAPEPVGLANYVRLFEDEQFRYAVSTSVTYMIICVPLLTFLPLFLALLVKKKVPGIGVFRTTLYFPVIASVVVVAIIWGWIFESRGLVNGMLSWMGVIDRPINFLVDRGLLIACAALLTIWKGLGYYMVVYLAALGNVDKELYEAASLDGAGRVAQFWNVTVPGVRGAMMLIAALITAAALRVFAEIYVLSGGTGGPGGRAMSVVMYIRQAGAGLSGQLGYASAISVALFILTVGPLLLVGWLSMGEAIRENFFNRRVAKKKVLAA